MQVFAIVCLKRDLDGTRWNTRYAVASVPTRHDLMRPGRDAYAHQRVAAGIRDQTLQRAGGAADQRQVLPLCNCVVNAGAISGQHLAVLPPEANVLPVRLQPGPALPPSIAAASFESAVMK